jgi:predicted NBD/HSP70 family sugar kinase/DNA-binding XRE family transcriptional regulator
MLGEIARDPAVYAGYEDARQREDLLAALVGARRSRSQQAVAATMGTTQSAVSDIENGRVDPRLSTLQRYARAVERRLEIVLCAEDSSAFELAQQTAELGEERSFEGILTDLYAMEPMSGPQSPEEVAGRTGLPEPTVAHTMRRLLDAGWLSAPAPSRSGKPRFRLNADRGLALGMSLSCDHIDAVLANLRTKDVIPAVKRPLPDTTPETVVSTVAALVQELQGKAGEGQDIVGLVVTLAGRIDGSTGTVYFAPDLQTETDSWRNVHLQARLEEAIRAQGPSTAKMRVTVENDANALAMYEYQRQGEPQSVAVVLMGESGKGIGSGSVVKGAVLHGSEGVGGEIGHIVVDPAGKPCRCDSHGCLETVASAAAIVERIQEADPSIVDLDAAARLAEHGDQTAADVFAEAGAALGRVLSSVTAVVGPRRLVIYGPPQLTKQLTKQPSVTSAHSYVDQLRAHSTILDVKVDVDAKPLDHRMLPRAAAATAVHHFLSRPGAWMPTGTGGYLSPGTSVRRQSRLPVPAATRQ